MTLLQQRDSARRQRRLEVYAKTRAQLRQALAEIVPGREVFVFGSLTQPGKFNDASDVDLAFDGEPEEIDSLQLMAEVSERLGRPVDIINLKTCRFRTKILRESERWTA